MIKRTTWELGRLVSDLNRMPEHYPQTREAAGILEAILEDRFTVVLDYTEHDGKDEKLLESLPWYEENLMGENGKPEKKSVRRERKDKTEKRWKEISESKGYKRKPKPVEKSTGWEDVV